MNTDERVLMVLARANPMPDTGSLELESDAVTYLAALQSRSSEMTQKSTRQEDKEPRLSRPLIWLAAAVAAVLIAGVFLLNSPGNEETPPATDPVPTTVEEPTPTTAPESTPTTQAAPTTTINPAEAAWEAIPIWNGVENSGVVRSINFIPEFRMTIPSGSELGCPPNSRITDVEAPGAPGGLITYPALRFTRMDFGSVEETVLTIIESAGITAETIPTDIAGAEGVTFDVVGQETQDGFWAAEGSCTLSWAQGDHWRFWVVDVAGEITTLSINALQDGFEETLAIYQPIIDSITWKELN